MFVRYCFATLMLIGLLASTAKAAPMTFTTEAAFQAAATGIPLTFEGFESLANSPSPLNLGQFTLSDSSGGISVNNFDVSEGTQSWGIGGIFGPDYPATITFNTPVNAVGFDVIGEITVATELAISINGGAPILVLNSPVPFIGIVDLTTPITSVSISQNLQADGMGVDRLQFGAAANEVPEPASLALWSILGTAGIAAWRRKRRATAA